MTMTNQVTPVRLFFGLAALLLSMPARADQATARQGAVDTTRRFTSPMIVHAPLPVLPGFKRTQFGREVADVTCDDVSLRALSYQVTGNRTRQDRPTVLAFEGAVVVPPSFDREVDVLITVTRGGETLGSRGAFRIDAEEGRQTGFRVAVPISRLEPFVAGEGAPAVEITVTVRDNR